MSSTAVLRQSRMRFNEPVRDLLRVKGAEVASIAPEASVFEAIERMSFRQVGALVVLDGKSLVGIVSERDYARKVILRGRSSRETRVSEIMSPQVVFVTPDDTIDDCMRLMSGHQVRHLPVMESDKVTGMVSIRDIVGWIISSHEQTIHQLENYITGSYPA